VPGSKIADFDAVMVHLGAAPVLPRPLSPDMVELARRVHDATYSLVLWRYRLDPPSHAQPFLDEIASDALQILPQMLLGYTRATKIFIRGIIENALRYIYFIDHPVEFFMMNSRGKWYLGVDKLFDYIKSHPNYQVSEPKFDAVNRLQTLYDELSADIHGRKVENLEGRLSLIGIEYNQAVADVELSLVQRCSAAVNFCLAIENRRELRTFTLEDKGYVFGTMPKAARLVWHEYVGVIERDR
jgi:hypothetical protein